jgi:tRNA threonylcarbamoyladenosine biosynthesis protein TsaB
MAIILNIDTSQNGIYISVSENGTCLASRTDDGATNQAQFLNVFVEEVLQEAKILFADIHAVAVVSGPGSYTGLRIGMASAKGFCMALDIPLIAIDNLYALAFDYVSQNNITIKTIVPIFIPMANEIIFAKYTVENNKLIQLQATTHVKSINNMELADKEIIIKNNKNTTTIEDLKVTEFSHNKGVINTIAFAFFANEQFADLILAEPNYVKEAYIQDARK